MWLLNGTFITRSLAPMSLHATSTSAMKQVFRDDDRRISMVCSESTGVLEQLATSSRLKKYAVGDCTGNLTAGHVARDRSSQLSGAGIAPLGRCGPDPVGR